MCSIYGQMEALSPIVECAEDSGFISLAQALQCANPEMMFAMMKSYTLYCDAAGGKDHGFIVVAGYLSTFARWNAFAAEWNLHLAAYNLPYFHMKEFAQSRGVFEGWGKDEERRKRFLSRAAEIIKSHVERSFAVVVEFESFNRVNQTHKLDEVAGVPYSLAARNCAAKASLYLNNRDVNYVFEAGDEGAGELMRLMERDGYSSPVFRPSHDIRIKGRLVKGLVQLQAADFAAYEVRKAFKDNPDESWPIEKYRKSIRSLATIDSDIEDWGRYREQELIALCEANHVSPRE